MGKVYGEEFADGDSGVYRADATHFGEGHVQLLANVGEAGM